MGRGLPPRRQKTRCSRRRERAHAAFDATRGDSETNRHATVRDACAYGWRQQARTGRAHEHLRLLPSPEQDGTKRQAEAHQRALIDALSEDEQQVFAAWALQKHLGKRQVQAEEMATSIGLSPRDFDNAKRRLKGQRKRLLARFGWSAADVLHGEDHVDRTG